MTTPDHREHPTGSAAPGADSADSAGAPGAPDPVDIVVLAGGTGRRLDGVSKPDVVARGARLLDHVLSGLEQLRQEGCPLGRVCVVAPAQVALPGGVLRALEDPPLGGPVAGIAAGLARLERHEPVTGLASGLAGALTAVLTCDAPSSWRALPALIETLRSSSPDIDGVCVRDGDHRQYLLGLYRRRALTTAVSPGGSPLRDVAVRRILGRLRVAELPVPHDVAGDLDTWAEVRAWDTDLSK